MSNFNQKIDFMESFDDYYINWDPSFDKDIIKIINKNSLKNSKSSNIDEYEKFCYEVKKLGSNYNCRENLKIEIKSDTLDLVYNFKGIIGSGSCGFIFLYNKVSCNKLCNDVVLKFGLEGEENTSKNESSLHFILNSFQKKLSKDNVKSIQMVPNLDLILMTNDNFYHLIMERANAELGIFFREYHPLTEIIYSSILQNRGNLLIAKESEKFSYWNIYLEFLFQICIKLIYLQDNFKFMHNDLKCNNILVKFNRDKKRSIFSDSNNKLDYSSLVFLLCDLGGASYIYNKKKFEGTILGSDAKFNRSKDLFHLVHMQLAFSEHRNELIDFINKHDIFKLEYDLISKEDKKWIKIYTYVEDGNKIDKSFNPRILKEKLISISKGCKDPNK